MKKQDLKILQKKGQSNINSKMNYLIGAVILVVMVTAVAPTMIDNVDNLTGVNETLPSEIAFLQPVLYVIVGAGLIFLVWRAINGS